MDQYEVMVYLTGPSVLDDRTVMTADTEFAKRNPGMLTEQNMIRDGKFVYEHHTEKPATIGDCRFLAKLTATAGIAQPNPGDPAASRYWYRAMTREEFRYLKKHGALNDGESFGGIGTGADYSKGYMGWNKSHDYLIQFTCEGTTNFDTELEAFRSDRTRYSHWPEVADKRFLVREQPKAEGGGTYGLGKTGHYKGLAGKVFNKLMSDGMISWNLVHFIVRAK